MLDTETVVSTQGLDTSLQDFVNTPDHWYSGTGVIASLEYVSGTFKYEAAPGDDFKDVIIVRTVDGTAVKEDSQVVKLSSEAAIFDSFEASKAEYTLCAVKLTDQYTEGSIRDIDAKAITKTLNKENYFQFQFENSATNMLYTGSLETDKVNIDCSALGATVPCYGFIQGADTETLTISYRGDDGAGNAVLTNNIIPTVTEN